jgi:hypothetical protein
VGGACSAAGDGTEFGTGGAGSTESGTTTLSGTTQSGTTTLSGVGGPGTGSMSGGFGGACASSHHEGKTSPLDIYIMLDKSGSMDDDNKWVNCTTALKTFVQSPLADGIGVGIKYFPAPANPGGCVCNDCNCYTACGCSGCSQMCTNGVCTSTCTLWGDSCNPQDYAIAAVEIGLLPGNAQAIINSINGIFPNGGTPTRPALEGALIHARDWNVANPDHKVVVVLATDGEPSGCANNTVASVQQVAAQYLGGTPSIPTYVIGVGSSLTSLNAIAASGGTTMAYIVDSGANTTQQFLDAMNAIRQSAGLACEYIIPAPMGGTMIDFDKVNVQYLPGNGGAPVDVLHADTAAQCDPVNGGWYYDSNTAPTKILMCPATCNTIKNDQAGKIDLLFGCPTKDIPPA